MINVIAIDDEPLALLQLQRMIELTPYFHLVAACPSAFDAMRELEQHPVDAIFADINMPDLSGIDFVRSLTAPPIIVFTTAYQQYAIDSFKVDAIDYLLKPFGQSEFQRAAAKVKRQYELIQAARDCRQEAPQEPPSQAVPEAAQPGSPTHPAEKLQQESSRIEGNILFVKDGYNIVRISMSDISHVESQSEYLRIIMTDGSSHMVLMSIRRLADMLPADTFVRIHRSYIVNMAHVVEISHQRIRMNAEIFLPIGDSYKEAVLNYVDKRLVGK